MGGIFIRQQHFDTLFIIILCGIVWRGNCQVVVEEEDPCRLPPQTGSCSTSSSANETNTTESTLEGKDSVTRYYYSLVNYKCAPFPYSGCNGNANNFLTVEECNSKCGKQSEVVNKIRKALNSTKCWYNDKLYEVGEQIPETGRDNACSVGCYCAEGNSLGPKITCAAVDCFAPPDQKNCVPIYKNNTCCPSDYVCEKNPPSSTSTIATTNVSNTKNGTETFKCKFQGRVYIEGETIYPDNYPCHTCKCTRNFTGVLSTEDCREVNCGISIHNQYELVNQCEPQYYTTDSGRTLCCPIMWNCRNQEEEE